MSDTMEGISWGELASLTHAEQVGRFGWCICEDEGQGQLADDCPRASESGECDQCFTTYDIGSQLDHCAECGTCWDHCKGHHAG